MSSQFNYIEEANVTMSDNFHKELVSHQEFLALLDSAIEALANLDKAKKALFYGRPTPTQMYYHQDSDIAIENLNMPESEAVRILHGIIGVATEAGEMLDALCKGLEGQPFDAVNLFEECGDNQWYVAAILRVLQKTFTEAEVSNIAKLRKRFPNKFTEFDANNRNLHAERVVLEGSIQPLEKLMTEYEQELANGKNP